MGLFHKTKMTPETAYQQISDMLIYKPGSHIHHIIFIPLGAVNSSSFGVEYANYILDGMRNHGYNIIHADIKYAGAGDTDAPIEWANLVLVYE